jgi:hypothetical protein
MPIQNRVLFRVPDLDGTAIGAVSFGSEGSEVPAGGKRWGAGGSVKHGCRRDCKGAKPHRMTMRPHLGRTGRLR